MTDATPLTDSELTDIEQRLHAATPRPWQFVAKYGADRDPYDALVRIVDDDPELEPEEEDVLYGPNSGNNWELFAHAPTDEARLIAEVRRLRKVEAEHQAATAAMDEWVPLSQGDIMPLSQRIANEAADFEMIADHLSRTYYHFTNGNVSRPNTLPDVVFALAEDCQRESDNQEMKELRAELAGVKTGYDDLNRNWAAAHNEFSDSIRGACGMPDATLPELCDQITEWRQQSSATRIPESGEN